MYVFICITFICFCTSTTPPEPPGPRGPDHRVVAALAVPGPRGPRRRGAVGGDPPRGSPASGFGPRETTPPPPKKREKGKKRKKKEGEDPKKKGRGKKGRRCPVKRNLFKIKGQQKKVSSKWKDLSTRDTVDGRNPFRTTLAFTKDQPDGRNPFRTTLKPWLKPLLVFTGWKTSFIFSSVVQDFVDPQ